MQNLRRLGAEAGILAGIATALLFLGYVWFFPQAGLSLAGQANPHLYMKVLNKHEMLFWTINVLGGMLAALMSAVLFRTLEDRFEEDAQASARIGALFGMGGAFGFAASALLRQVGFSAAATIYKTAQAPAVAAFRGVQMVEHSMFALGQVAMGLGAIVLGIVMLHERRYSSVGYLSAVAGTTMFLSAFVSHTVLFMGSFALMAGWLTWTALILRSEAGPGLIRFGAPRRGTRQQPA